MRDSHEAGCSDEQIARRDLLQDIPLVRYVISIIARDTLGKLLSTWCFSDLSYHKMEGTI